MKCFLLLCLCSLTSASLSGLYMDNGHDQTIIHHSLTRQEKREVEHEILHLLGLPDRPRTVPVAHLQSSAPKFLLDVYKSLLEPAVGRATRSEFNLSGRDLVSIDESDVIMSFASHSHHEVGVRHERGKRLWFDVSEVPAGETISGAELRLYQVAGDFDETKSYAITIYKLVADDDGEKELEYVDSVNTTSDNEGWLLINVTSPVVSWVALPASNLGLYLSVHEPDRPAHEIHPDRAGLVNTKGEEERRPFMVAFLKASSTVKSSRVRTTREAKPDRKRKAVSNASSYSRNPLLDPAAHWSSRSCQIQTLYVSFRDLEWQDWIIAPDGYGAFYCSGECNFPLNAHMNATNHAIVQTLVHLMNPTQVPKPCCAPTKLIPISVLYFLDDTNVILKKYKNMVVKSCGCH